MNKKSILHPSERLIILNLPCQDKWYVPRKPSSSCLCWKNMASLNYSKSGLWVHANILVLQLLQGSITHWATKTRQSSKSPTNHQHSGALFCPLTTWWQWLFFIQTSWYLVLLLLSFLRNSCLFVSISNFESHSLCLPSSSCAWW